MGIVQTYTETIHNLPGGPWHFENDKVFNVPAGTLTINEWSLGTQFIPGTSVRAILFWDQNSDGKLVQIDSLYTSKATRFYKFPEGTSFVSTGNSRVIVHRAVLGKDTPREVFVRWAGDLS